MTNWLRLGGLAALGEAVIYLLVFSYYGTLNDFPAAGDSAQKLAFLAHNQVILALVNLLGYVVFGILLTVLVLALHERLKGKAPALTAIASVFGLIWVALCMASGMLANIGLEAALKLAGTAPEQAWTIWQVINTVVEGFGGGNEVVGGLWVLLISSAALSAKALPRTLNYLGVLVGSAGMLTIYPAEVLTEIFGLSQIVWFAYLGVVLLAIAKAEASADSSAVTGSVAAAN